MQEAEPDRFDASAATAARTATAQRPDAGTLARGVWEAPPWAFYVAAGVVLLAALVYAARAAGLLQRRRPRDP